LPSRRKMLKALALEGRSTSNFDHELALMVGCVKGPSNKRLAVTNDKWLFDQVI
jgi:hypothetical protein